jgi:hypothetical protein
MKEITEGAITYLVSDNYPTPPYVKTAKTAPVIPVVPTDPFKAVNDKLDALALELATIKTQTKPKV